MEETITDVFIILLSAVIGFSIGLDYKGDK